MPKTTKQNQIVRRVHIGKSEAEVTNNKKISPVRRLTVDF